MPEGLSAGRLYYELGWQVEKAVAGAATFEATGNRISQAASKATDAVQDLARETARTPAGLQELAEVARDLAPPVDRAGDAMRKAGGEASKWTQGLKLLSQQQAEAALTSQRLGLAGVSAGDRLTAGLTRAAQASAAAAEQQTTTQGAFVRASGESVKGAHKIQNALVSLALSQTNMAGSTGKLIEGLLLLGAGSLAVTGAAAGIALLAALYNKLTEEQRKTKQAADEAREAVRKSLETPTGVLLQQKADAQARIEVLQAEEARNRRSVLNAPADQVLLTPGKAKELQELLATRAETQRQLDDLRASNRREADSIVNGLKEQGVLLTQAIALRRTLGLDTTELQRELADTARVLASVQAVPFQAQGPTKAALEQQIAARRARVAAARSELLTAVTAETPRTIDATAAAIEQLRGQLRQLETPAREIDQALQPLLERLAQLKLTVAEGLGPEQALAFLDELRQGLVDQLAALGPGQTSPRAQALLSQLAVVDERRARANLQIVAANQAQVEASEQVLDNTEEATDATIRQAKATSLIVGQVADIARGAIGIAQGFGAASDSAAALLQNVVSVGSSLPGLIENLEKLGKVDATGQPVPIDTLALAGQATALVGGLVGLVAGLVGDSPEARRLREATEHNADVIVRLTREIGNLNVNVSGTDFAKGAEAVNTLLGAIPKGTPDFSGLVGPTIRSILAPLGLSISDLKDLAAAFDIQLDFDNLDAFRRTLVQLQKAMAATELTQFSDSFEGAMQQLADAAEIFHLGPEEQLQALADKLLELARAGKGSQAIADALTGLDLSDPSQRAEARTRLEELFRRLTLGEGDPNRITPEDLGLTLAQFRDLLKTLTGLIDQTNEAAGTPTGGGPLRETAGDIPRITEARASELAGLLTSIDTRLVESVTVSREIRDLLAQLVGPAIFIPPPALPVGTTAAGAGGLLVQVTIQTLTMPGATTEAGLRAAGVLVGQGIGDGIAAQLGRQTSSRTTWLGTQGH